MDITRQGIITLLKSAITGMPDSLPEGFDLGQAAAILKRHSIIPLAYLGAAQCGYSLAEPVMQQLFLSYRQAAVHNDRQMKQVEALFRTFETHGIDYMPVKGCNLKALYPAPEVRPMGDADILIRLEQYPAIRPLMLELGFTESVESNHELVWLSEHLMVELHKRLIPSYNRDYYSYYGDGWKLAKFHNGHRFYMSHEDEYIYLFTHFAKHYRDGGIGLRQLLDLWVFRRHYSGLDLHYVEKALKKMQLDEFFHNIMDVLDVWFCGAEETEKTAFISDFIFQSGSWGSSDSHRLAAIVKQKQSDPAASAWVHKFLLALFPPAQILSSRYPALEKAPYLLPWFWLRRIFEKFFVKKGTIEHLTNLTPGRITEYEQALSYVGLGFHFHE